MRLQKTTFQIGYLADGKPGRFGVEKRQAWPCKAAPGSDYCIARRCDYNDPTQPNMSAEGWAVWHKPSGKVVRRNLTYAEARALLEKIEAANLAPLVVDGNSVKPEAAFDALKALVRRN
jgi:hypothetical protein